MESVVAKTIDIPVFPIIRPRGGDFLYTDAEFEVMKNDILVCKELGFAGVVIGLLLPDGNVDIKRTKVLVDLAAPMAVTFHRAFDRCKDPIQGLHDIIATGCKRILTSGQVPSAPNALSLLKTLVKEAGDQIIIMPGSGVRGNNIATIKMETNAQEFHSSARKVVPTQMQFVKESMQENLQNMLVDAEDIQTMLAAIA
jgi:copper homeostasis protein